MPRIKNIQKDLTLTSEDKLLGSDKDGATRNYSLGDIAKFVEDNSAGVFKHVQTNAAATWTVTHNLDLNNYLPNVTVKISGGTYANVQATGIVTYVNNNELTIAFSSAQAGLAYIRK
tara:strand:- start:1419 stop:1769 length:351 start_codon:yes stop_codon:yes gene_type:complete